MKKKLPNIFKNNIKKPFNNNTRVFYSANNNEKKNQSYSIDELFKQNEIYKTSVSITLKNGTKLEKIIIGRSIKHLITKDNELIPIDEILLIAKQ